MSARVIGVGQAARGDDGAGLRVVDALRALPLPAGTALGSVREPTALLDALAEPGLLVIADAIVGAGPPGKIRCVAPGDLETSEADSASSHGLGVAEVLELVRALGGLAATPVLVTIAIDRPGPPALSTSPAVARAIPAAAKVIRAILARAADPAGARVDRHDGCTLAPRWTR